MKALGFDMAEGVNEPCLPGDCGIFVTKVDKGSMDNTTFITLKLGDLCFDIPVKVIEEAKPFNLDCVANISKIKGGEISI